METTIDWLNPSIIWFVIGFILILMEFATPGLVTLFFGIGAWIVAILILFFDFSVDMQLIIFIAISVISLIFLRKHFKKLFQKKLDKNQFGPDGLEEFIGHQAVVIKEITPKTSGKVEFRGTSWKAVSSEHLKKNTPVKIVKKDNITLVVKSMKKEV